MRRAFCRGARMAAAIAACALAFSALAPCAWGNDLENKINPAQMPDNSFLYDTSIYDLLQATGTAEGNTVQVTGEVVGDLLTDSENPEKAWITLSSTDSKNPGSISVYIDKDDAQLIDSYGGYGVTGTILRVKGTFHVTCTTHEATMDIHADSVSAVQEGAQHPDEPDLHQFTWGIVLVLVGAGMTGAYYVLRERQR